MTASNKYANKIKKKNIEMASEMDCIILKICKLVLNWKCREKKCAQILGSNIMKYMQIHVIVIRMSFVHNYIHFWIGFKVILQISVKMAKIKWKKEPHQSRQKCHIWSIKEKSNEKVCTIKNHKFYFFIGNDVI